MKGRRSLNLLVAATGLVFLSGCATETLTDSAFWSYLPFGSSKGGKGSGDPGTGSKPKTTLDATSRPTDQPNPATTPQRSTDPASEGWNDPVKPGSEAGPVTPAAKPKTVGTDQAVPKPTPRLEASAPQPKSTPVGTPLRTDVPVAASTIPGMAPAFPAFEGRVPDGKATGALGIPSPVPGQTAVSPNGRPHLAAPAASTTATAIVGSTLSLPETAGPTGEAMRPPLRIPELFVDGIGPATVGKPTLAELPKRSAPPQPGDALSLPREVVGQPTATNPGRAARRLPRAITDDPKHPAAKTATLPLPGLPADAPKNDASQAFAAGAHLNQPNTATANLSGPGLAIPGDPATKSTDGRALTGGIAGGPATAKPKGDPTPLPNVEQAPPLPSPPIPTPFRLSEWISNDAMHQAWRRQQSRRAQLEPEIRGGEQQRLRLLLDTYLLREKPTDKPEK